MIDALIDHAKRRGFEAGAIPGLLLFSKVINGQQWGYSWAISHEELNDEEILMAELDHHLDSIYREAQCFVTTYAEKSK